MALRAIAAPGPATAHQASGPAAVAQATPPAAPDSAPAAPAPAAAPFVFRPADPSFGPYYSLWNARRQEPNRCIEDLGYGRWRYCDWD